jgi:uncharacterized protein YabN with tetrapyrrole methylase and pyrophosphatase domain
VRSAEEIGDVLFTLAMLARRLDVDADEALAAANAKFQARFARVEEELRRLRVPIGRAGAALMDRLWNEPRRTGAAERLAGDLGR